MIFPNINKDDFKENINNIEILSNNGTVSAVKNKKLNVTEYIFWQSGSLNNITVDNPCILLFDNDYIYVSEPTHKLKYISVIIDNYKYQIAVNKGYPSKIKILN